MTRPGSRPSSASAAAAAASMSGAVDLSGLAQPRQQTPPGAAGGDGGSLRPVVEVSEAEFESEVLQRSAQVPVVVSLGSAEYPQCVELDAMLEKAATAAGGRWVLAKVDIRRAPRIAQAFGAQSVPTVVAVAAGRPVDAFAGVISAAELDQWLAAIFQASEGQLSGAPPEQGDEPERDPRLVAAEQLLDSGDFDGAAAAYEALLHEQPGNTEAAGALKQVRFLQRAQSAPSPQESVAASEASPEDIALQLQAADALLLAQRPDDAFDRLVAVVKSGGDEAKAQARARLLELLELFDAADEHVIRARRNLANALY